MAVVRRLIFDITGSGKLECRDVRVKLPDLSCPESRDLEISDLGEGGDKEKNSTR